MSKASRVGQEQKETAVGFDGELIFLAFPLASYRALSDHAAKKGKTAVVALQEAVENYLRRI